MPECNRRRNKRISVWTGALSAAVSRGSAPLVVGACRRGNTRLTAVIGGLVLALASLFTSFALHTHQVLLRCVTAQLRDPQSMLPPPPFSPHRPRENHHRATEPSPTRNVSTLPPPPPAPLPSAPRPRSLKVILERARSFPFPLLRAPPSPVVNFVLASDP